MNYKPSFKSGNKSVFHLPNNNNKNYFFLFSINSYNKCIKYTKLVEVPVKLKTVPTGCMTSAVWHINIWADDDISIDISSQAPQLHSIHGQCQHTEAATSLKPQPVSQASRTEAVMLYCCGDGHFNTYCISQDTVMSGFCILCNDPIKI